MATKRERHGRWHYVIKRAILPKPVYLSFDTEAEGDLYVARVEKLLDHGVVPDDLQRTEPEKPATLREHSRKYLAEQHVSATDKDNLRLAPDEQPAGICRTQDHVPVIRLLKSTTKFSSESETLENARRATRTRRALKHYSRCEIAVLARLKRFWISFHLCIVLHSSGARPLARDVAA